jgi:hypothetical protein
MEPAEVNCDARERGVLLSGTTTEGAQWSGHRPSVAGLIASVSRSSAP